MKIKKQWGTCMNKDSIIEFVEQLESRDFSEVEYSEIKEIKKEIKSYIQWLYTYKETTKDEWKEVMNLISRLATVRDSMANNKMKKKKKAFKTIGRIHFIVSIIALLAIFIIPKILISQDGNFELVNSVKNAEYAGYTLERIFKLVGDNSDWYGGTTEDGIDVVQVEFDLSMDVDHNGINELRKIYIQWVVGTEQFKFHTIAIDGATQNAFVGNELYSEILDLGASTLDELNKSGESSNTGVVSINSSIGNETAIYKTKEEDTLSDNGDQLEFDYISVTLSDIVEEFGLDYEVVEFEGGYFLNYDGVPYSFGFSNLEDSSVIVKTFVLDGGSVMGISPGMNSHEVIDKFDFPESMGNDEMDETDYMMSYTFSNGYMNVVGDNDTKEIKYIVVGK